MTASPKCLMRDFTITHMTNVWRTMKFFYIEITSFFYSGTSYQSKPKQIGVPNTLKKTKKKLNGL